MASYVLNKPTANQTTMNMNFTEITFFLMFNILLDLKANVNAIVSVLFLQCNKPEKSLLMKLVYIYVVRKKESQATLM